MITEPVIRNVLFPCLPTQKGARKLVEAEACAEVRRAVNAWAYGVEVEVIEVARPEWAEEA